MGNKEIENLLEDNYKKLCEKSEELKQAISEKINYELSQKNYVPAVHPAIRIFPYFLLNLFQFILNPAAVPVHQT